jgi:hypothetical protein
MNDLITDTFPRSMLEPGTRVEVQQRFDRSWTRGFEVAEVVNRSYRLRRFSDGAVLPYDFATSAVRPEP